MVVKQIIGISGKVGSGKSFIAEHISRETGIKLIKLDYQAAEAANKPILKQMLQRRLKIKIPKAHKDIQLLPLMRNMEKEFSRFEFALFRMFLNRKVKKIIRKSKESLIIDFVALPILKVAKKFDKMYLVKSNEDERFAKLSERDNMPLETVKHSDKFIERYYAFNDAFHFDDVIDNNYQVLPEKVVKITEQLSARCGSKSPAENE